MKDTPTVTIFYIATKRYLCLWERFYDTMKRYFLPECKKRVILFTDRADEVESTEDVTVVKIPAHPWPYITLLRFHIFMDAYELWKDSDYVFFMNANYEFLKPITSKILPEKGLVAGLHFGFTRRPTHKYPYERNPKSTACIPMGQGKHYYQGALNGGTTEAYAAMCRELIKRIDTDLQNDIIAIWHDESHLNRYLFEHGAKALPPTLMWPEERNKWYRRPWVKAILRDKSRMGGHAFLRSIDEATT